MEIYLGGLTAAIAGLGTVIGVLWKRLSKYMDGTEKRLQECEEGSAELQAQLTQCLLKGTK